MGEDRQVLLYSNELKVEQGDGLIPCFRCGVCCIGSHIHLTFIEARRISDNLGTSWQEFEDNYIDPLWLGGDRFLLRQSNGACIFLKREKDKYKGNCMIHPFRPFSCIGFTPSLYRKQCQAGLAEYWGLTVSPSTQLLGADERIKDFNLLCSSLSGESTSIQNG